MKELILKSELDSCVVIVDVGGDHLRLSQQSFLDKGYQVKVINLITPEKSLCYNPFEYLRCDRDINVLVKAILESTYQKRDFVDPFWDHSEGYLLVLMMRYLCHKQPKDLQNFITTVKVLNQIRSGELIPTGEMLGDTAHYKHEVFARVLNGLIGRVHCLSVDPIRNIIQKDNLDLDAIGKQRTALFVVLPFNDERFDCLVAMLLAQLQQRCNPNEIRIISERKIWRK